MHVESLKMFCDVVEAASFSRAAQLNHVTQSAISQQIRALEERYQQRLLSRTARSVSPTAAGERLFHGAKEILARFSELEAELREQAQEVSGTATVATIYSVGLHELSALQKALLKAYPKVNLRLSYRTNEQVYDDVFLGSADMGLVAYPAARSGIDVHDFREDRLAFVCAPNHALAGKSKVPLAAVAKEPLVAFTREAPTRGAVDRLFKERGLEPNVSVEMDNVETMKRAVELGLGVSVLPLPSVRHETAAGTLVARPFAEGTFARPIGILVRKGKYLSRAANAVLETLQATAKHELSAVSGTRG